MKAENDFRQTTDPSPTDAPDEALRKINALLADPPSIGEVELDTAALETLTGAVTETAPASDTASSGLNGRLQRIAQRITSLIALLPASLGGKTAAASLSVTLATDHAALPLPTGASTAAKQPALGTAGTPSADVISVQGVAGGTPLSVATAAKQTAGAPSNSTIITAGGDQLTLAAGEIGFIRNLGTNPLFVKLATGASSSSFQDVLAGGVANDDGLGGAMIIDDFTGVVSATGTSPRFMAWKRAL